MDERMGFMVCCIEMFRSRHALTGGQVMDLFKAYGVLDYLESCYGALHVMGNEYVMQDIEGLIEDRMSPKRPPDTL